MSQDAQAYCTGCVEEIVTRGADGKLLCPACRMKLTFGKPLPILTCADELCAHAAKAHVHGPCVLCGCTEFRWGKNLTRGVAP